MELEVKNLAYGEIGGKESFDLKLDSQDFEAEDNIESIEGIVKLTRIDEGILAEFQLDLRVKLACDRCLADFTFKPKLKFSRVYSLAPIMEEDSDLLPVSRDMKIEIGESIREEALLSIPVKKVCKASCAGICPTCGTNLNVKKCKCSAVNKD